MKFAAALLLIASQAQAACGDGFALRASEGAQIVAFRSQPAPIPVDKHFKLELQLCPAAKQPNSLRVDADMPLHRHGMNYRATVVPVNAASGRYRAEGLLFHMPGRWRLIFDLVTAEGPVRLTHEVDVQ